MKTILEVNTTKNNLTVDANNISEYPCLELAGISLRQPFKGREYEFVYEYIQSKIPSALSKQKKTVFVEPRVDSTFPDIVIVYFDNNFSNNLPYGRPKLRKLDFKILHYIFTQKSVEKAQLKMVFPDGYSKSLKLLIESELIESKCGKWQTQSLKKIFGIQRLIAIEAKISNWQQGLQQAFRNSWFASESYLLLPHIPNTEDIFKEASRLGVGILTADQSLANSVLPPQIGKLPKSYASWLFNEWTWRLEIGTKYDQKL